MLEIHISAWHLAAISATHAPPTTTVQPTDIIVDIQIPVYLLRFALKGLRGRITVIMRMNVLTDIVI
jgi:hypothetical protein